ncbi:hypothetical protein THARTR1_02406 [Trichoderma harzianum]|uniref:Uncharacterized protein n=1 Tax=Trichoderma harzianum TaxID=5544 RepID=A0A2K0UI25_TRIHA|nr:hypothetical protein THARTR1_02406 [Trichoderma harzianum]
MAQLNTTPMGKHVWTFDNPRDKSTVIARFYYSFRGGNTETSHELMLRSIVYQIWRDNSRLYKLLSNRYRELQKSRGDADKKKSDWSYEDLKSALRSLHQIDFFLKVVIVVDGMDESDNDRRADVLRFLPHLAVPNSKCIVKVLIASRPESDINSRLRRACSHHIKLQDVNEEDIRLVVEKWIKRMEVERNCKPDTFEVAKDYILKASSGVFLWVTLVLREMEKCLDNGLSSKADLNRIVLQLPKELGGELGFYKRMILPLSTNREEDLYQQARGRRIFYWVTFPKRPISAAELQDVLATPLPSQGINLSSYNFLDNRPLELDRGILSACGGLVELRDSYLGRIVQLIHQTAREFLLKEVARPYYLTEADGDVEIATTCCQIICIVFTAPIFLEEADDAFSRARILAEDLSSYDLLIYALTNFTKHLNHMTDRKEKILTEFGGVITVLRDRPNSYATLLLSQWIKSNLPKRMHFIADEKAMKSCVQATLGSGLGSLRQDNLIRILTALQPSLLHFEVEAGNEQTAKLLLDHGSDPNGRDNNGQTPLLLAAEHGNFEMAQLLVENGSDPTVRDVHGQTPVALAVRHGHVVLHKLLEIFERDLSARGKIGQTPSSPTARHYSLRMAVLLMKYGIDPNARGNNGQAPLSVATTHWHETIADLLELKLL